MAALTERPDFLFSIVNRTILGPREINFAKIAAINYHDSPLPAYAGVNAPSWAILNGESTHGITWHRIVPEVDAGEVLVQRHFGIDDEETALSLSAKCFDHALEAFEQLLEKLEAGDFRGKLQDPTQRTYFGKARRLPRQGIIRWSDELVEISRFIRAGLLGPYANDFGIPKILLPDVELVLVGHAEAESGFRQAPPGMVLKVDRHGIFVATGGAGVLRVSGLTHPDGRVFEIPESLEGLELPIIQADAAHEIEVNTARSFVVEGNARALLAELPAPLHPHGLRRFKFDEAGEHVFQHDCEKSAGVCETFARIIARLLEKSGARPCTIGLFQSAPMGFLRVRPFACGVMDPFALAEAIESEFAAPPIPVDLPARFPELHASWLRIHSISVCLSLDPSLEIPNPGLVICMDSGNVVLRFAASQIQADRAAKLAEALFNGHTVAGLPSEGFCSVHQRIAEWASATPEANAVEDEEKSLTFSELDRHAEALASHLHCRGAGKEGVFAILLPQGCDFVVAVLAILKSGSAHLPLDPSTPIHRLREVIMDARPLGIVTDRAHANLTSKFGTEVIFCDSEESAPPAPEQMPPESEDLAYVIYTSGSTGEPKGSMIEHGALARFIEDDIARNKIVPGDRVLQLCSVAFDASVEEIFSALCAGATLVIRPGNLLDSARAFIDFCEEARLTIIGIYSSMFGDVLVEMEQRGRFPQTVRLATTGGEMVGAADAERWRRFFAERNLPAPVFLNVYGLTETTVANCAANLSEPPEWPGCVPIGRPFPGNLFRLADGKPDSDGTGLVGELLIGGQQLARAYWNRPALNAARFFNDPVDGSRWFQTGDIVRVSPGGEFYFDGRIDRQVKVNGVRVELEDIERAMLTHPGVSHAFALLHRFTDGREILAGFFSPASEELKESLRLHLAQRLPEGMRPRRLVPMAAFAVNDRGKTDRSPLVDMLERELGTRDEKPEDAVLGIWREFFPWSEAAQEDESFFDLGGDSLLALRLLLRIEQVAGVHLPVSSFFREPTLGGLRRLVVAGKQDAAFDPLIALKPDGSKTPLYILHGMDGDVGGFSALLKGLESPAFGVRSPAVLRRGELPVSMEAAAREVVEVLQKHRQAGPWILLGYSWAGILAYEVAVQIGAATGRFPAVVMIDSVAPVLKFGKLEHLMHFLKYFPGWALRSGPSGWVKSSQRILCTRSASLAAEENPEASNPVVDHFLGLVQGYDAPHQCKVIIHLIRASNAWRKTTPLDFGGINKSWRDYGWKKATGSQVHIYETPSNSHHELMQGEQSLAVAGIIKQRILSKIEGH